jgi:hypothetical protein
VSTTCNPALPKEIKKMTTAKKMTTEQIAALNGIERVSILKAEAAGVKAAYKAGQKVPATPVTDWVKANPTSSRSTKAAVVRAPKIEIRYAHDGRLMPDSQNRFSSVAYYFTKGISTGKARLTTEEFRALVVKLKGDPAGAFDVTLPNGIRIEALLPGQKSKGVAKAPAATVTAKASKAAPKGTKTTARRTPTARKAA